MVSRRKDADRLTILRHCWHTLMGYFRKQKFLPEYEVLHPLSPQETGAIDAIAETPAIIVRELGEVLQVPKSTLTSILDRLEREGYIRRVMSERDRRSFGLELTALGTRVYEQHIAFETATWKSVLALLDDAEQRQLFVSMMDKISRGLESTSNSP